MSETPMWQPIEFEFEATIAYEEPLQQCELRFRFESPSGRVRRGYGFWDGGETWRVRFAPDEPGVWLGRTTASRSDDSGLHDIHLEVTATEPTGATRFDRHGPIRVAGSGRHFEHLDGTPFFWLADTAWNGPLLSTEADWQYYLDVRREQGFDAVQWVATHWLASVEGDSEGRKPYTGRERIAIDPVFFARLDAKHAAIRSAGSLSVPVMLWAAEWRDGPGANEMNPGYDLPEDQAILLARYMLARWDADPVAWFLPGDGPYTGERAARWQRIGRAVFGEVDHAPVTLHPDGMSWVGEDFDAEDWVDYIGYQSGHGDGDDSVAWLVSGPPADGWQTLRPRPVINLEPPYEGHVAYHSKQPFSAAEMRKRLVWSLLVAPTAGVTYGGHGVWGWDDGMTEPMNHPGTGIPLPWREGLRMPGAQQLTHLLAFFESIDWWRLVPAPDLVVRQPGDKHTITASRTENGDLAVVYLPESGDVHFRLEELEAGVMGTWVDPETGATDAAESDGGTFRTPGPGDRLLRLQKRPGEM